MHEIFFNFRSNFPTSKFIFEVGGFGRNLDSGEIQAPVERTPVLPPTPEEMEAYDRGVEQRQATETAHREVEAGEQMSDEEMSGEMILSTLDVSEGEQAQLTEIQDRIAQGQELNPDQQDLIATLGQRLESQGAEELKEMIISEYPEIPGLESKSPQDVIQFADHFAKVRGVYNAFKGAKENAASSSLLNSLWEKVTGRDTVDAGAVGQGLRKLQGGEILSPSEMEKIVASAEMLDDTTKIQMYAEIGQDMLQRMIPGVNIAKDGLTAQALTADMINTLSILAMGVSGGASLIANLSIKGQRVAKGIMAADVAATAGGAAYGGTELYRAVQEGNTDQMAINGAMVIMGILGARAGIDGMKIGSKRKIDVVEGKGIEYMTPKPNEFNDLIARRQTDGGSLSVKTDEFLEESTIRISIDKKTGFGLSKPDENGAVELFNVFSLEKGRGKKLMLEAVREAKKQGAKKIKLDAYEVNSEGFNLKEFYEIFGFKEVRREKNWTPGEPDVIFMERNL